MLILSRLAIPSQLGGQPSLQSHPAWQPWPLQPSPAARTNSSTAARGAEEMDADGTLTIAYGVNDCEAREELHALAVAGTAERAHAKLGRHGERLKRRVRRERRWDPGAPGAASIREYQ